MALLSAIPADPFINVVVGAAVFLMLLAFMLLRRSVGLSSADPKSPTNLCLKCLDEGHDPLSALEFVADWGPTSSKREFQDYAKLLKQGRLLDDVLERLRRARPTVETELLIACLASKAHTGQFSAVSSEIVRQAATRREQTLADLNFLIGGSRRWVIGLVWIGILGGAMLLIALPVYSHALLQTPIGRLILSIALILESAGLIMAGRLLSLPARSERELSEP